MNIYEIDKRIEDLFLSVDEYGELGEEVFDQLAELKIARETKLENVALWIKNLRADAEGIKQEKLKLAERQKAKENKIKSLENYLIDNLDGKKLETERVAINWRKSTAVIVDDEGKIPDLFKIPQPDKIDKNKLKKVLNGGAQIEGAHIEERNNIQIK